MDSIEVYVEAGMKKVFAGGVEWPGWCRSGRDERAALQSLVDYGSRYAQVLRNRGIQFEVPAKLEELKVVERLEGNSTTDFGAPAIPLTADKEGLAALDYDQSKDLLEACWLSFDQAVQIASGKELRKGPRGGGREIDKIVEHLLESDRGYLGRLAWQYKMGREINPKEDLARIRKAILDALQAAVKGELPERGPRGGILWPPRYFIRRVAWHVLDHAWEIEDRVS